MFIGEFQHSLDQKGRLAVPVKFRDSFVNGAVVTRGIDKCLFVYSKSEWEALADKISKLPLTQSNSRAFARLMFAGAVTAEIDKQGRILLPEFLKKYAELSKQVVVAGVFNRLEIWNKADWENYKNKTEKESSEIAEKLFDLGI